jgi:CRP/FNR family transcriptional regulator
MTSPLSQTLLAAASDCPPIQAPAHSILFETGASCRGFPLLLSGEVKVFRPAEDGRQIELYRLTRGDICLVSSACLFGGLNMLASSITTQASSLLLIPPARFEACMAQAAFRAEILAMFAQRMTDLTELIDAVAFQKLDQRLAQALLGHGHTLSITHQQLADQLGTVREVVTRLLHRFEREGWIALSREHIEILNSAALRLLSSS